MKIGSAIALVSIAVALVGCQPESKPAVSLEEARQVTAQFAGEAATTARFVPPPRTISDVVAVLDAQKPDPAKTAQLTQLANALPPAGASGNELADFLYERGAARVEIGQINAAIDDFVASNAAAPSVATQSALSMAQLIAGRLMDSLRTREAIVDELKDAQQNRGRLFSAYSLAALIRANIGDIDRAESHVVKAERLLDELQSRNAPSFDTLGPAWSAVTAFGRAEVELNRGHLEAAERSMREAIEQARRADGNIEAARRISPKLPRYTFVRSQAIYLSRLSVILARQGRLIEAELAARDGLSLALATFGRYNADTGFIVNQLATVLLDQGRFDEALALSTAALDIVETVGHGPTSQRRGMALRAQATANVYLGNSAEALRIFDQLASDLAPDQRVKRFILGEALEYGEEMLHAGRTAEAETLFTESVDRRVATLGVKNYRTAEARGHLAAVLAAKGDKAGALAMFHDAVPILLAPSRVVDDEGGKAKQEHRRRFVLEAYLALLAEVAGSKLEASISDVAGESFRVADALRGRSVQQALAASSARAAANDPDLADLVRREQDALRQIGSLNGVLVNAVAAPADQQDPSVLASLRASIDALRGARATIREEVERRFPDYVDLIDPRPATIDEVQTSLRQGEVLLATYVAPRGTYVWVVRRGTPARFYRAPLDGAAIDGAVAALRRSLDPDAATLGDIPAFDVAVGNKLYAALVAPAEAELRGANDLIVVPHGALGQLPFSVLVTKPHQLAADVAGQPLFSAYRDVPFLARRLAVTHLPSVASLAALRRQPPGVADRKPFIGFGDPWFSQEQAIAASRAPAGPATQLASRGVGQSLATRGVPLVRRNAPATRGVDSAELALLPRLPDTAAEVRSIAAALKADPASDAIVGSAANERTVQTMNLADRRVVMFATHGLVPGDLNGLTQPALALSAPAVAGVPGDGLLTLDEIVGLRLSADWVVLSACNTASGDGAGAEAVSGLGRAFFYAGTRAVLVTNWPVETTSARVLTTEIFRQQAEDPTLSRAEALRRASVALIDGPGYVDAASQRAVFSYAHPIFWAPFSLYGDGGGAPVEKGHGA